jgi:peptidoglycan hydrolase-like protein with peptidoglycan-binding domain
MTSTAISRELLAGYEGLNISAICTAVRFVDNAQNHCAHFVNHVLGVDATLTCGQLLGRHGTAANIRVHETFALCRAAGNFQDRPLGPCLVFVVQRSAIDLTARRMTNLPQKHIGIFCDGEIWHYSNTQDKVVRETPEVFARHFPGEGFGVFFGTFPSSARALPVPHGGTPLDNAVVAPKLGRGQRDNIDVAVWQQFLIVRQLLSGPNIRTLLDGSFGPNTEDATEAFQMSASLPVTGSVDAATNRAAIAQGFVPRVAAKLRAVVPQVTPAMTVAAVEALNRLSSANVFYTEEALSIDGRSLIARLEPHKHTEGTQLRFWHRGITLYTLQDGQNAPAPSTPVPSTTVGHAGIDTSIYPGDAVMAELRSSTNLIWTGFYLGPAPSHTGASWMGKRSTLIAQGWGLAVLYVGQQESGPGSHNVNGAQGDADGANALALAAQAEFPPGTVLYLDIETGGPFSPPMRDYLERWSARIAAGGFVPGAYLSFLSADSARQVVPDLKLWVYRLRTADSNVDKDPPFRESLPSESGVASAVAWQWAQNCWIPKPGGGRQLVDLDVASTADPSRA